MPAMRKLLLAVLLSCACASVPNTPAINTMLDDWHDAAAKADESRYFGAMTPEFVFLGTDATERWDVASFREFAHPYFAERQSVDVRPARPPRHPRAIEATSPGSTKSSTARRTASAAAAASCGR